MSLITDHVPHIVKLAEQKYHSRIICAFGDYTRKCEGLFIALQSNKISKDKANRIEQKYHKELREKEFFALEKFVKVRHRLGVI